MFDFRGGGACMHCALTRSLMYVRYQRFMYLFPSHLYAVTTPTLLFRNVEAYNNLFYAAYNKVFSWIWLMLLSMVLLLLAMC